MGHSFVTVVRVGERPVLGVLRKAAVKLGKQYARMPELHLTVLNITKLNSDSHDIENSRDAPHGHLVEQWRRQHRTIKPFPLSSTQRRALGRVFVQSRASGTREIPLRATRYTLSNMAPAQLRSCSLWGEIGAHIFYTSAKGDPGTV